MWLDNSTWKDFIHYEEAVDNMIQQHKMIALCSYYINMCGASEIIDIVHSHRYIMTRKEGVWAVTEDSQHKKIDELSMRRDQLSRLLKYVQSKRELEKRGAGKEIHDEIAQVLLVLKWRLNSLDKKLQTVWHRSPEEIGMLSHDLDKAYRKAEMLFTQLVPSILNHLGFGAALEWQIDEFKERTGIRCEVNVIPEAIPLNWVHSTMLFRISEALLANVEEHANATELKVELNLKEDSIELKIIDNGIGITEEQVNDRESYGLAEVKESVILLRGKIDIKGFPDKGTLVLISIKSDRENN